MAPSKRPDSGSKQLVAWARQDDECEEDVGLLRDDQPKGCWARFTSCVGGIWATRQMTNTKNREVYVRTTLRELLIYIIFLVTLCILTFGMQSSTMYYHTKVMTELFLDAQYPDTRNTFRGSTQVMDFFRFAENVLVDGLYWENNYDTTGDSYEYNGTPLPSDDRNILYENKLLGKPRLRQLRVKSDSCNVHEDFTNAIRQCFNSYAEIYEDREPFGLEEETAWRFYSSEKLETRSWWGKVATYSGSGSYVDLSKTRGETVKIIAKLKSNLWITRATRVVFVDFTVYNANINLFCVVKLAFEFPATGGMVTSWTFHTVKLLRYVDTFDFFILACEFLFCVFILYYIVEEALEIRKLGCSYFFSFWNVLDIVVILISLVCIAFSIFRYIEVGNKLDDLLANDDQFANFEFLGFWQTQFNNAVAITVFFAWIKLFKYISFNKTMTQLNSTLSRAAKDVAGFAIMFFIVFFAFAQLGYLLFGTQVYDYSSFGRAVFTLLRIILGDFNFHEIESANRVLGPIYFLTYVFFVFFVLLNMFLAIINDTYSEVKAEIAMQRNEFEISDYFKRGYNNMMSKVGRRDKLVDIQNAIKLAEADSKGSITFDTLRMNLKKVNFSDMEIEMFFASYDLDGDRILGEEETRDMMRDLEGKKTQLDRAIREEKERPKTATAGIVGGSAIDDDEFNDLSNRVETMEKSLGTVCNKIDTVLSGLEKIERDKQKHKETFNKVLDTISNNDNVDDATKRRQMETLVKEELSKYDD